MERIPIKDKMANLEQEINLDYIFMKMGCELLITKQDRDRKN